MTIGWHFKELVPGYKDRQATQGEFFATDAIRTQAEAVVREAIQNSLDAAQKPAGEPVRVRFYIGELRSQKVLKYFRSGIDHFRSADLDEMPEFERDNCRFLVVEDFGTTGLEGNFREWKRPSAPNPFYYFFRAEGTSEKGEEDRGRWGIGKFVFPRSSRVSAFFAYTVKASNRGRLLMGQTILQSRQINGKYYTPDGDFGVPEGSGNLTLPIVDHAFLDQFCADFEVARKNDEPGLSIVVPYLSDEIRPEDILNAVIENYFYSIVAGTLIVNVDSVLGPKVVDKTTIRKLCAELDASEQGKVAALIRLSETRLAGKGQEITILAPDDSRPIWKPELFPKEQLLAVSEVLKSKQPVLLKVPLVVRKKKPQENRKSDFVIVIQKDESADGAPTFVRDGLTIPGIRGRKSPGYHSIVVAEDGPLAELLGDAENPSHTQWQNDRAHFKSKYTYGKSYLDFVIQSAFKLLTYVNESDGEVDIDLLADYFSIPKLEDDGTTTGRKPKRIKGTKITSTPLDLPPRVTRYSLQKIAGGFKVTKGSPGSPPPQSVTVKVAYDCRKGSPLANYSPADFRLTDPDIEFETIGCKVIQKQQNKLTISITDSEFSLCVTGFDENRDLFLQAEGK